MQIEKVNMKIKLIIIIKRMLMKAGNMSSFPVLAFKGLSLYSPAKYLGGVGEYVSNFIDKNWYTKKELTPKNDNKKKSEFHHFFYVYTFLYYVVNFE